MQRNVLTKRSSKHENNSYPISFRLIRGCQETLEDATPLRGGVSRSLLPKGLSGNFGRCHLLAGWRVTVTATKGLSGNFGRCHPLAGWRVKVYYSKRGARKLV